jgi:proliferating cell nuclear antigen
MVRSLELKTVQTNAIKVLTEALKDILTDANIEFDQTGLKIVAMDSTKTILVHLKLNSEKFDKYSCTQNRIVGVSMSNLFKLIKTATNNDTLTFYMDSSNPSCLGIIIENGDKNTVTSFEMNLMDINEENIDIPPQEFESIITMPSIEFQKICRDMNNLSDAIEIKSVGAQLIFSCKGDFATQETKIGETPEGVNFVKSGQDSQIIQGYYNLKHLFLFTKCTNLCNSIEIYMKNDFPIVLNFSVGNLGKLKLALAPRIQQNNDN